MESPTQAIALRRLDRPHQKRKVLRMVLDGKTDEEVAAVMGVHQSSIYRFRERHASEIEELVARFEAEASDYLIADKVTRIADYDEMRSVLRRIALAEPEVEEPTRYGVKKRVNSAFERWQSVDDQAARELDQLPRAGVTVNNQNVVIVKQVVAGEGNPELG